MAEITPSKKMCPSHHCAPGTLLTGIVQPDKTVALLGTPLMVDEAFVETATQIGPPEKRFRFAGKCVKGGCRQWTGSACGLMDLLAKMNEHITADENLQPCAIRPQCRWYTQEGAKACAICTYVVTDNFSSAAMVPSGLAENA